jgi:glycosyltransferase involved in cell wall biosynthesis
VIAAYGWPQALRVSAPRALEQTPRELELLVVGDGCRDETAAVAAALGDERVRFHGLERNSGSQSAPNNDGIALARGRPRRAARG